VLSSKRAGSSGLGPDERRPEFVRYAETVLEPGQLHAAQERGERMTLAAAAGFAALLTEPAAPLALINPVRLGPGSAGGVRRFPSGPRTRPSRCATCAR
jgi:hypothetical protein